MANEEHLALLKQGIEVWNKWRDENPEIRPNLKDADLRNADLRNANLIEANLIEANLYGADLRWATLADADLRNANLEAVKLNGASLLRTNFQFANLIEVDFVKAHIIETNFHLARLGGANLKGANLIGNVPGQGLDLGKVNIRQATFDKANLSKTNLSGQNISEQNFRGANLRGANLSRIEALGTDFRDAIFTEACIEDWNINSQTNLNGVICDHVYQKADYQDGKLVFTERRPHDPNKNFAPGEFTKLFQKALETVDLIFKDGIDWQVFLASFQQLQVESGDSQLLVQSIEKKPEGAFVIRVEVPRSADKAAIEASFWQKYQPLLEAKDEQIAFYCQETEVKRKEIEQKREENTMLLRIIETMVEKENTSPNRTIHINTYYEQSGNHGIGHMSGGEIKEGAKVTGILNEVEKQNLAEAAEEIQQILEQLSQTYPTETLVQKAVVAEEAIKQIENKPTLKKQVLSAIKAMGVQVLMEAIDHPVANVFREGIEAFQEPTDNC